jgi:hypothetical protein
MLAEDFQAQFLPACCLIPLFQHSHRLVCTVRTKICGDSQPQESML